MNLILWLLTILNVLAYLWLLVYLKIIKLPKLKKDNALYVTPVNPNELDRPCQFCGANQSSKSKDGYYACDRCMVIKLNHAGPIRFRL